MTSSLLTPCRRGATTGGSPAATGGVGPTPILDRDHPRVTAFVREVTAGRAPDDGELLRTAHALIARTVRPVYSLADRRPVSEVLRRGRGSCSQRLSVLEAVARSCGIATRVRGLLVDGAFWYPRFPRLTMLVPDRVVLAWPEFRLDGAWVAASALFGEVPAATGYTNAGPETLFDALSRGAVDWDGPVGCPGTGSSCDLSARVLADLGHYDSRDALFTAQGQTLCLPARVLGEPVLGRWPAGGGVRGR
ncbi:transglutaminase domain-containing protein [Streptomyces sp. NPDC048111]|uniref:transglutaminase domain-containing protein n=1 Tax=Streptomyces sp. NPDC048111 TaxID=3365500 RepID=UPI003714EB1E